MFIFPLFVDDFDFLICEEKMATENISAALIAWCNYFTTEEFTEDYFLDQTIVYTELFNKCNPEHLFSWMQALRTLRGKIMTKIPLDFQNFVMEVETAFAAQLEEESGNTEDSASAMIAEKLFWEALSTNDALQLLKTRPILFSSQMSFTKKRFQELAIWLKDFEQIWGSPCKEKKMPKAPNDSLQLSGIPKKRKMDISMSTTVVSSPKVTVDAHFSKVIFIFFHSN